MLETFPTPCIAVLGSGLELPLCLRGCTYLKLLRCPVYPPMGGASITGGAPGSSLPGWGLALGCSLSHMAQAGADHSCGPPVPFCIADLCFNNEAVAHTREQRAKGPWQSLAFLHRKEYRLTLNPTSAPCGGFPCRTFSGPSPVGPRGLFKSYL